MLVKFFTHYILYIIVRYKCADERMMSLCVAVQHERAPRASPSKPKYLTQFAAAAAAGGFPPYYFPFKSAFYPPFFGPPSGLSLNGNHPSPFPLGMLGSSSSSSGGSNNNNGGSGANGNNTGNSNGSGSNNNGNFSSSGLFSGDLLFNHSSVSGLSQGGVGMIPPPRRGAVLICRPSSRISSGNVEDKDEMMQVQQQAERITPPHKGSSEPLLSLNKEDEVSSSGGEEPVLTVAGSGGYHKFLENLHIGNLIHESVYESAAKLLFLSVKWARSVPSFLSVS
jgi:hypothetical protein